MQHDPLVDHNSGLLVLPEKVQTCPLCKGNGQYKQFWCDAPPGLGACDMCSGAQWVYESGKPVAASVREQIANMNGLVPDDDATCFVVRLRGFILFKRPEVAHG